MSGPVFKGSVMVEDYDRLWEAIRISPFMTVYLGELYWLSKRVVDELGAIFEDTPIPPGSNEGYIRVDHDLHAQILGVLISAARIRSLIRERESQGSRGQKEILARRTAALRSLLDGIDLETVLDAAARNSVEHFDEYLDGTAIKSYRGVISRPTLFAVDMVLSRRNLLEQFKVGGATPTAYSIRAYIADERTFCNCGRELNLGRLHSTCDAIRLRAEPLMSPEALEERGGSMLVVTKESFDSHGGSA